MNRSNSTPALPAPVSPAPGLASTPSSASLPIFAQEAINVLAPPARQRLRDLFTARAAILPIAVTYAQPQQPADPWAIFELRKSGSSYSLTPTALGPSMVPTANGMFVYVVLASDPGRVYVGVPYGSVGIDQERFGIQGHTSLTGRADVLYAGEIILKQGQLTSWGNASGHYQPPADLRHTNLLPVTQTLLPEARFIDYWRHDNSARQAELGQLRGYMDMIDPQARSGGVAASTPATSGASTTPGTSATPAASGVSSTSSSPSTSIEWLRLRVGNSEMRLEDLIDMGARIDGLPVRDALRGPTGPELLRSGLADRLSFDGDTLQRQIQAQRIAGIDELFFELAGQRTGGAPLVVPTGNRPRPWITQFNEMLARVQTLSAIAVHQPRQNIVTCMLPGYSPIRHTALGLHLFGLYNGLRGLRTAVARGDVTGSVVALGELTASGGGIVLEEGLQQLGAAVHKGATQSLNQFSRTAIGMRLGGPARLGVNLARSAPLIGALITAPFDAYNAVDSFRLAGQSSGRQALDHYVNGSLASVSFVTTVGLGAAGFAGLASAGPIGLATGAFLVAAGRTYSSVRYVEDLQKQIPLSMGEIIDTGLRNVIGLAPSQDVEDRRTVRTAAATYRRNMQRQLSSSLGHLGPLGVSQIVFGDAFIKLRAPLRRTEEVWNSTVAGELRSTRVIETRRPPIVIDNSGDDDIDAYRAPNMLQNVVNIVSATDDKVLWMTGTGDDKINGFFSRSNLFNVRAGKKTLRGDNQADLFELQVAPNQDSSFDGGLGTDTLRLSFATPAGTPLEVALAGHPWRYAYRHIEDQAGDNYQEVGRDDWQTYPRDLPGMEGRLIPGWIDVGGQRSRLKSIENVITSSTATTIILGNGQDNLFVLNGRDDSVDGGLGDDTYIIQGGGTIKVKAGAGNNRYQLARTIETVEIESARTGQQTLHLDFYLHELLFEARAESVEISVAGTPNQRIVLKDIYQHQPGGPREAVRADGQLRMMTRDAMAVTPLFSRYDGAGDGLIELLAKPLRAPVLPAQDRFATAQEIQQLDQLVAISGGWQTGIGAASAANGGSMAGYRDETLLGNIATIAA